MKGLVVKSPYIEDILNGIKTIEVRGSNTKFRGKVVLLKSGSGTALGTVEIMNSVKMDLHDYNSWEYRVSREINKVDILPYRKTYAWILKNPIWYKTPKKYFHPCGAIIWVNLPKKFENE